MIHKDGLELNSNSVQIEQSNETLRRNSNPLSHSEEDDEDHSWQCLLGAANAKALFPHNRSGTCFALTGKSTQSKANVYMTHHDLSCKLIEVG